MWKVHHSLVICNLIQSQKWHRHFTKASPCWVTEHTTERKTCCFGVARLRSGLFLANIQCTNTKKSWRQFVRNVWVMCFSSTHLHGKDHLKHSHTTAEGHLLCYSSHTGPEEALTAKSYIKMINFSQMSTSQPWLGARAGQHSRNETLYMQEVARKKTLMAKVNGL